MGSKTYSPPLEGLQNKLPSHVGEGQGWGQYSEREADDLGIKGDYTRLQTPPLTPPLEVRGVH